MFYSAFERQVFKPKLTLNESWFNWSLKDGKSAMIQMQVGKKQNNPNYIDKTTLNNFWR